MTKRKKKDKKEFTETSEVVYNTPIDKSEAEVKPDQKPGIYLNGELIKFDK